MSNGNDENPITNPEFKAELDALYNKGFEFVKQMIVMRAQAIDEESPGGSKITWFEGFMIGQFAANSGMAIGMDVYGFVQKWRGSEELTNLK